jgi:hypothetical protein
MDSNDELRQLPWNTVYGRIEAERLLVGKCERGEELNEYFRFLIAFKCAKSHTNLIKAHTEIKSNPSLTITEERQQNQTLILTFSMVMPNVAR